MTVPWPSLGTLVREGFDQPYGFAANQMIDGNTWSESWSGWNLNRRATVVTPWVVPMVVSNAWRVEPERGAIRFWYCPDFNSGVGPGNTATLLTLRTANNQTELVWWTLVVSPNGSEIHLVSQTEKGPQSCLQVEVKWRVGDWHLVTLGFTPTNSALFLDAELEATGPGLATVPNEAASLTDLIVGSNPSGTETARGQIEELWIFSGRKRVQQMMGNAFGLSVDWEIGTYYSALGKVAALGPISEEEIAARKALAEQRQAEREMMASDESGGMEMMMISGAADTCVTNAPPYITNVFSAFDSFAGWTVTFEIQGSFDGTNTFWEYDVFQSSNLASNQWTWLERGPSCSTYQYVGQPTNTSDSRRMNATTFSECPSIATATL